MKKLCILLFACLQMLNLVAQPSSQEKETSQEGILVVISDVNDPYANIRQTPSGKVVACLENGSEIRIDSIQSKWCRISSNVIYNKKGKKIAPVYKFIIFFEYFLSPKDYI